MSTVTEILTQLRLYIPIFDDRFTTNLNISSITKSGSVATVTTSTPHGLSTNDYVTISGVKNQVPISSLTQTNGVASATTSNEHDLTLGFTPKVTIIGADQSEYNGSKTLLGVEDANNFTFTVDSGAVSPATGTIYLLEDHNLNYNGRWKVTVLDSTSFTISGVDSYLSSPAYVVDAKVKTGFRIWADATYEHAKEAYTRFTGEEFAMFFIMDDTTVSKSRYDEKDSVSDSTRYENYQKTLINNFSIYTFIPTRQYALGGTARDISEEFRVALFKTLARFPVPSDFIAQQYSVITPISHGTWEYNKAYYVHRYEFQFTEDIVARGIKDGPLGSGGDTVSIVNNRAFRSINLKLENDDDVIVKNDLALLDD